MVIRCDGESPVAVSSIVQPGKLLRPIIHNPTAITSSAITLSSQLPTPISSHILSTDFKLNHTLFAPTIDWPPTREIVQQPHLSDATAERSFLLRSSAEVLCFCNSDRMAPLGGQVLNWTTQLKVSTR